VGAAPDHERAWTVAGWTACALSTVLLLWFALACHPVGDYQTESDFYGAYAAGARAIQHGHVDPSRYVVIGPGYEFALALVSLALGDLFLSARLLSVASAVAILVLWFVLVRRRLGATPAAWTVLFLAANPVFFRYGYSATTDMLACALQAASILTLFAGSGRRTLIASGAFAALATLTRYNSVALVPAALLYLAVTARGTRARSMANYLTGFGVPALGWLAFSIARGTVPGADLVRHFGFYRDASFDRNIQDAPLAGLAAPARGGEGAAGILIGTLRNIPAHLVREGRELLGWPLAALALVGLIAAFGARWRGRALPLVAIGAAMFLALAPIFYSDRYALAELPVEAALAGLALALIASSGRLQRAALPVALALAVVPFGTSIQKSVALQAGVRRDAPIETIAAGRTLDRVAAPGARVISRKGHVGYYSGRVVVPFPRYTTLAELAGHARAQHAEYLYYSWYETGVRPEFRYLLDTTAVVPGLSLVSTTQKRPSVLYRIGPGFGRDPDWMSDPFQLAFHNARAMVAVLPDSEAAPDRAILAVEAMSRGATAAGLALAERATRDDPRVALGWVVQGDAHRLQHHPAPARTAYERALALDPADAETRLALGEVEIELGSMQEASATLRPLLAVTREPAMLRTLDSLFVAMGDPESARRARAALAAARAAHGP
jgi:tetratricopeptide (TPR) repeat protein